MRRSGRRAFTSATSALIVWADLGSRLPWARATRAGAAISWSFLFSRHPSVDPALGLARAGPAPAARVVAGGDTTCARGAPDGRVAVVHERIDEDSVVRDVTLHLLVAPASQGRHLDLAL